MWRRYGHAAATLTMSSDCVDVVLFGGYSSDGLYMADTVLLRYGRCDARVCCLIRIGTSLIKLPKSCINVVYF